MKFAVIVILFLEVLFLNASNIIFKNYTIASTYIPSLSKNITKYKRSNDCITLILNVFDEKYKLCINVHDLLEGNELICNETKFFVYGEKSNRTYNVSEACIQEAKGYVMDKPFSSSVYGHIENGKFYGRIQIKSKTFYVEDISKFPSLVNQQNHKGSLNNALIYENSDVLVNSDYHKNFTKEIKTIPDEIKRDYFKTMKTKNKPLGYLCSLFIFIDNSFLRIVANNDIKNAVVKALQSLHEANSIFRSTDFDEDGVPDNVGFKVKYIIIIENEKSPMNIVPLYSETGIDGRFYLLRLSQYQILTDVCLGVAFTAQPFLFRALGMSYTAMKDNPLNTHSLLPRAGGICERPTRMGMGQNFNNLVITYCLENDERVPQVISDLSLAHELGHAFGSDHDEKAPCFGHLMSPHTFHDVIRKNFMFSSCSKKQISYILNRQGQCLEPTYHPFCGNGIVEADEECDCGNTMNCFENDLCCIAKDTKGHSCRVNREEGYECHPSQGLCCTSSCQYRDIQHLGLDCRNSEIKCHILNDENGIACGLSGKCLNKTCHSNECTRIGLEECECPESIERSECITCCLSKETECLSAKELTKKLVQNNTELFEQLSQEAETAKRRPLTLRPSQICKEKQCTNLLFRSFQNGDYCLYKGQLGICLKNFVCYVSNKKQQYPTIRRITSTISGSYNPFSIYCLLNVTKIFLFISLCYSFMNFFS